MCYILKLQISKSSKDPTQYIHIRYFTYSEAQLCAHRTEQRAGDWVSDMVLGEHEAQI